MAYQTGPISSFTEKIPSSADYLPIVDTTDPFVKNKKATVGNLFKGVPYSAGNTSPAIAFGSSTQSGIFSPSGTQVGVRVGNTSSLTVTQTTGAVTLGVSDTAASSSDLTLQAYGSGKINFASSANFTDSNFVISSSTNSSNTVNFNLVNVVGSNTLTVPFGSGTIVTDTAIQSLSNKTLVSPNFTGTFVVNPSTNDLVVTNNKVGIGIASPDYKLHVVGDIKVSGSTPSLRITGTSTEYQLLNNNSNSLDFNQVGFGTILSLSSSGVSIGTINLSNIAYTDSLNFVGSGSTYATFNSTGALGIGTTSPLQKLDIVGAARISGGLYRPDNNNKAFDYDNSTTYHYSNQQFKTGTGSATANVVITSLGLVGIGKTTPNVALDVSGRTRTDSFTNVSTLAQKVVSTSISSNTLNIDPDAGSVFSFTLNQNINTINYNFSKGSVDSNSHFTITLIIAHDGSPYSINWNPNAPTAYRILWVPNGGVGTGNTAGTTNPVLQTAGPGAQLVPSKDIITLTTYDSGTTFIGRYVAAIPAF
jgi:hypothetical protein